MSITRIQTASLGRRNLPLLLLQLREQVMGHFRVLLNAQKITEQQWRIVRVLLESEPLEPQQIGRLCRLSSPSLAGVLSRMETLGLVVRERVPKDRRRLQITLTLRSRRLAKNLAPQIEATYRQIEAVLGQELSDRLLLTLDQVITKLQRDTPQDHARHHR